MGPGGVSGFDVVPADEEAAADADATFAAMDGDV